MYIVDQNGKKQKVPVENFAYPPVRENFQNVVEHYGDSNKVPTWVYWVLGGVGLVILIVLIVWLVKKNKHSAGGVKTVPAQFGFRFF